MILRTETRDIVNDLSYGCVFVQKPPFRSAWTEIYCKLLTGLQFLGGLAQASSIVKARTHTSLSANNPDSSNLSFSL